MMRQLNNIHFDTIQGASARQSKIVSSASQSPLVSQQKDEKMNQLILKGLGKRKVKSILNKWIKDQINVCLEYNNGHITFDYYIYLDRYGVNGFHEDGVVSALDVCKKFGIEL